MIESQLFYLLTEEYSLLLATTPQHFTAVKRIRKEVLLSKYQTYSPIKNEEQFLLNDDDKQSFTYLLQHNTSQKFVGTVRLFFINKFTAIQQMPMQKDGHVQHIDHLTHDLPICEVSRLALIPELPKHEKLSALSLRTSLSLALMCATRINLFLYAYQNVFAIMEPSLYRLLSRQNVHFEQIGPNVDYFGICTPFAIERKKLLYDTETIMGRITRHYLKILCDQPEEFWRYVDNNPYLTRSQTELETIDHLFQKYGKDVDLSLLLSTTNPVESMATF